MKSLKLYSGPYLYMEKQHNPQPVLGENWCQKFNQVSRNLFTLQPPAVIHLATQGQFVQWQMVTWWQMVACLS